MWDNAFSKAVGPFFSYLSRWRYSSAPPRTFITSAAVLFLCRSLSLHSGQNGGIFSKHPSFSEKANTWIGGRNNFRFFLRKHSIEIFTESKKFEKGITFNIKLVFPPRLLHLYQERSIIVSVSWESHMCYKVQGCAVRRGWWTAGRLRNSDWPLSPVKSSSREQMLLPHGNVLSVVRNEHRWFCPGWRILPSRMVAATAPNEADVSCMWITNSWCVEQ